MRAAARHGSESADASRTDCAARCARLCAALACAFLAAGCASYAPPKPWEKGNLARPEMQFDPDPLAQRIEQHVYASKEAATGGYGVGGGGCGCN